MDQDKLTKEFKELNKCDPVNGSIYSGFIFFDGEWMCNNSDIYIIMNLEREEPNDMAFGKKVRKFINQIKSEL